MTLRREALFPATAAFATAFLAWLYFAAELPLRTGVVFHHMASVRELAKGELPPSHNLVAGKIPQGHYGPYLVALGLAHRWSGAEPLLVLETAGLALLVAFLFAFRALAVRVVGPAAAAFSVLATLLLWGPWPAPELPWIAWGWPGTTSPADAQNFFYPQHAAVVLLLVLLCLCLRPGFTRRRLALAVLLSAGLITTHPLTALSFATAAACLVASDLWRREAAKGRALMLLLLPGAGLLLAGVWPYYPVFGLLRALVIPDFRKPLAPPPIKELAGAAAVGAGIDYPSLFLQPFHILGPALLGLVWAVVLARRRQPFLLLWSLASLLLAVCPLVPLRERLVTFAALPLQLAACGLLAAAWQRGRASRVALVLLLGACAFVTVQRIGYVRGLEPLDVGFVARFTPEDAIVLADERTSNAIAGETGRKIVSPEGPDLFLIMNGGAQRMIDVRRFLGPGATAAQREAILRRWHVTHVLLDRLARSPMRLNYPIVYEGDGYALYDVREKPAASP